MHMTGSEEKLFGLVLSSYGLSYQDTDKGILIQDSNGKPYQDKKGQICYFQNASEAVDAISWIFNVKETPYQSFKTEPAIYLKCKKSQEECDGYEWWTKGEWYECVTDGNRYYIETNYDVWKDWDMSIDSNQQCFDRLFDAHTKEEYERTLNYGTYDDMGEVYLPDDLHDYN